MPPRNCLPAIVLVASLIWAALLYREGVPVSSDWIRLFGSVTAGVGFFYSVFDIWAWRLWGINRVVPMPDLNGTWRVTLRSEWKDPETGETPGPITAYMVVRQTYSTLSMRLMTAESESYLLAGSVTRSTDSLCVVAGLYQNTPQQSLRHRARYRRRLRPGRRILDEPEYSRADGAEGPEEAEVSRLRERARRVWPAAIK
jgi:hypothetical protein